MATREVSDTTLYVHVPFCVVKCGYCDFNSYVVEQEHVHDQFLAALDAELRAANLPPHPPSVFIGGGTPTLLHADRLRGLFDVIASHTDLRACGEVTMEANPESVSREKAEIALAAGVTRMSVGVQSFTAATLKFLDRAHTAERSREAVAELRAAGVENLSIDLMFGTPGQTLDALQSDLRSALELRPDHISYYNLVYEPGTKLRHALDRGDVIRNDDEVDRSLFLAVREALVAAGYEPYEISNFAGPGGPCRHNDHYWLQGDYVGVGPGASSHRAGVRSTNLKTIEAWAQAAVSGGPPAASAETLTPLQRVGEAMWLGLRRAAGVDLVEIEKRVGYEIRQRFASLLDEQEQSGWIERAGDVVRLTAAGMLVADSVSGAYLQPA